jgi:microcompartment protein CcmK/EutM
VPPLDQNVLTLSVAVLAALAVTLTMAAAVLWRTSTAFSASVARRGHATDNAGATATERVVMLRGDLARTSRAAESVLWALPSIDKRIDGAEQELRRRRLSLDEARLTLLTTRDVVARARNGWRAVQSAIELGRVLGL